MIKKELDLFLYWIAERHTIYLKKEGGRSRPWTTDPILNTYKFTNPFRQNDRATKELSKRINKPDSDFTIFKKIIIFRMFNWSETYDVLNRHRLIDRWDTQTAIGVLCGRKRKGNRVFSTACTIATQKVVTTKGEIVKVRLVCNAIGGLLKDARYTISKMKRHNSLEKSTIHLMMYDTVTGSICYELR